MNLKIKLTRGIRNVEVRTRNQIRSRGTQATMVCSKVMDVTRRRERTTNLCTLKLLGTIIAFTTSTSLGSCHETPSETRVQSASKNAALRSGVALRPAPSHTSGSTRVPPATRNVAGPPGQIAPPSAHSFVAVVAGSGAGHQRPITPAAAAAALDAASAVNINGHEAEDPALAVSFAAATAPAGNIFQDNIYAANPFSFHSPTISSHPNEHFDSFTGGLSLLFKDVDLPGMGGFGITVNRVYSLNQVYQSIPPNLDPTGFQFQSGQFVGLGWQMHAGAVCGDLNVAMPPQVVQVIDPDQSVHQAYYASSTTDTSRRYLLDDGSELTMSSTITPGGTLGPPFWYLKRSDGRLLYFGQRAIPNSFQRCHLLTQASAHAALALNVSYAVHDRVVVPTLMTLRDSAGDQAAPDVVFSYDTTHSSFPRLDHIDVGGRTVMTYYHASFPIGSEWVYLLRSVQAWTDTGIMADRPTQFDYQSATGQMPRTLRIITYPESGSVQYDTAAIIMNVLGVQTFHPVLTGKQVWSMQGAAPETWTYTIAKGDPFSRHEDVTTVVEQPCGRTRQYFHAGFGYDQGPLGCSATCPSGETCGADMICHGGVLRSCNSDSDCGAGFYCSARNCYDSMYALWRMGSVTRQLTFDGIDTTATPVETRTYDFRPSAQMLTPYAWVQTPFGGGERHYLTELHASNVARGNLNWQIAYSGFDSHSRWQTRTETGDGRTRRTQVQYQDITSTSTAPGLFLNRISQEVTDAQNDPIAASRTIQRQYRAGAYFQPGGGPKGSLIWETRDGLRHNYVFQNNGEPSSIEFVGVGTTQMLTGFIGPPGEIGRNVQTAANTSRQITTDSLGRLNRSFVNTIPGTPPLGYLTQYGYDGLGRLTSVGTMGSQVASTSIVYSYSPDNLPQRTATRGRLRVIQRFDGLGRLTATETGTGTLTRTALRQYNVCGDVSADSQPFNGDAAWAATHSSAIHWESYTRDKLGRMTRLDHLSGGLVTSSVIFTPDPGSPARHGERRHDEMGNEVDTFYESYGDPDGGQIVEVRSLATGDAVQYSRDVLGQLRSIQRPGGAIDSFDYDPNTNFLRNETHPESGTTVYTPYPNSGWVQTKADAAGSTAAYFYDADGRIGVIQYTGTATETLTFDHHTPGGSDPPAPTDLTWDLVSWAKREGGTSATGRLFSSRIDRQYDPDLTLFQETANSYCGSPGSWQTNVAWQRTPEGFPAEYDFPGGFTAYFASNGVGDIVGLQTQRDTLGRQSAIQQASWHPNGELHTMQFGDGTRITQELNGDRAYVGALSAQTSTVNPFLNVTYSRRADLRLTSVTDQLIPTMGTTSRTSTFTYDALGRLWNSSGPWGSHSYAYRPFGDQSSVTRNGNVYSYQYNGQLLAGVVPTSTSSFMRTFSSYDGAGRLLQEDRTRGGTTQSVSYTYSADGYLASVSFGGTSERYQLDPFGRPACVRDPAAGQSQKSWAFGPAGDLLYSEERTPNGERRGTMYARIRGKVYSTRAWRDVGGTRTDIGHTYFVNDPMGTVLAGVQPDGSVLQQASTPFGELVWNSEGPAVYQSHSRVRGALMAGEPFDIYETPVRPYSASLGRYLTPDPELGAVGQILGHDRYSHALNDPNIYIDPSGRVPLLGPGLAYLAATTSSGLTVGGGLATVATAGVVIPAALGGAVGYLLNDTEVVATAAQFWLEKALGTAYEGAPPFGATAGGPKAGSSGGPGAGKRFSEPTKDAAEAQADGKCVFCGQETTRLPGPTQRNTDHAQPKSRGGNNTLDNAQNTCRTCNLEKGAKTTEEHLGGGG